MNTLSIDSGYTITVIPDEQVALAGSIPSKSAAGPYFIISLLVIMAVVAAAMIAFYMVRLDQYKKELIRLEKTSGVTYVVKRNSLKSLRETISAMETEIAENKVEKFL